jgi:exodeoxyribonuclease V alpha subunit
MPTLPRCPLDDAALWQQRQPYLDAIAANRPLDEVQAAFSRFMLLAAERSQVALVNQRMESLLQQQGRKQAGRDWYAGRPVMITANDYGVGLFNGDIGFTVLRDRACGWLFRQPMAAGASLRPGVCHSMKPCLP